MSSTPALDSLLGEVAVAVARQKAKELESDPAPEYRPAPVWVRAAVGVTTVAGLVGLTWAMWPKGKR